MTVMWFSSLDSSLLSSCVGSGVSGLDSVPKKTVVSGP